MNAYNGSDLLLLHHTYDHTPIALVPPTLTAVGDIGNEEWHVEG
jgi:hypothetical protein